MVLKRGTSACDQIHSTELYEFSHTPLVEIAD